MLLAVRTGDAEFALFGDDSASTASPPAAISIAVVNHLFPAIRSGSSGASRIFRLLRPAGTVIPHAAVIG
jgi:hypothetical protein